MQAPCKAVLQRRVLFTGLQQGYPAARDLHCRPSCRLSHCREIDPCRPEERQPPFVNLLQESSQFVRPLQELLR